MRILSLDKLPEPLLEAAKSVSARLVEEGYEAWIVGGAVRDLLLKLSPKDVDIATNAHPDVVEGLFKKTTAVGKAFGTIVVHREPEQFTPEVREQLGGATGVDIEVTTYRADGEYLDGRRPVDVTYSESLEDDAARRDFTCNALFVSAITGELRDPTGGLEDLEAGRLRAVGVPKDRFTEDGLRLMRLARFEGRFGLQPEVETLEGARKAADTLRGVSPERIRVELEGMFATSDPQRSLARLVDLGLFERIFGDLGRDGKRLGEWRGRSQLFASSGGGWTASLGFALLLGTVPGEATEPGLALRLGEQALEFLRPSKALLRAVTDLWGCLRTLDNLTRVESPKPSQYFPLLRSESWSETLECARVLAADSEGAALRRVQLAERLEGRRIALGAQALNPRPLLVSADIASSGIERGPRWGALLREAEELQVDGELSERSAALEWLARQAAAPGS